MKRCILAEHAAANRTAPRRTGCILISSLLFMALHLTKGWATAGMVPIVLGAGILLGLLARSSGSLIPGMIGHILMDIGLFAFLVDWDSWRLWRATHQSDRCR